MIQILCESCSRLTSTLDCSLTGKPAPFEEHCPYFKHAKHGSNGPNKIQEIPFTRKEQEEVNYYLEGVKNGDEAMTWELIQRYWSHNYLHEAIDWCKTIYRPGNAAAAGTLASLYSTMGDDSTALRWLKRAYKDGDKASAYTIAECYDQGRGTAPNKEQAIVWYQKAARTPEWNYEAIQKLEALGVEVREMFGIPHPRLTSKREQETELRKGLSSKNEMLYLLIAICILTAWLIWRVAKNM